MVNELIQYRIAVASSDGIVVNQHFGRATEFYLYEIGSKNEIHYLGKRKVRGICQAGNHDDVKLKESVNQLLDCRFVLVSRIGQGASNALEQVGIIPMELPGLIEESIYRLMNYLEIQKMIS